MCVLHSGQSGVSRQNRGVRLCVLHGRQLRSAGQYGRVVILFLNDLVAAVAVIVVGGRYGFGFRNGVKLLTLHVGVVVLHRGVGFHTGLLGGFGHFGILCGGVVEPESAAKLFILAIPIGGSVRPSPVGGVFGSACTRERLFVVVGFAAVLIIRAKQAAAGIGICGLSGYGLGAGNHVQQTVRQRSGSLFHGLVGAVAVILVTGFDQLGNIKPGHFASFNFVFFGQGEGLGAVFFFHGISHSVITELGFGFGIPAQFSALQFLLQVFLHVLRRVFLRLGTGLTLDLGGGFKRGIGGGGSGGRGRTVRVGGGGSSGGRFAQHKLRVLGLRLGLFSFANGLFLCLAAAVLGAFLLVVQVGLRLAFLLVVQVGLVIAVLLAVAGGLLCAGFALFGHIAVHRAGALGGGGRIVLGDLVFVVVIIHADIRVADHIHSALVLLIGLRIGRHTGSSNGCRSRAFPFRVGLVDVCVIRVDVHLICRIRDQGLGRNTCGQCHRHCSNFKLFIRHDPRSPFLSPCV